jgi:hypothetical protein
MLTPDLDILVAPGELGLRDYGRLCRIAPYQEGDRVHRHKLTREGVAADLAAGNTDCLAFLEGFSRTGMPSTVGQTVTGWMRTVARVTLYTGVNILERDGQLEQASSIPQDARIIDYGGKSPPAASFLMVNGEIQVPRGQDALTVRAVLDRVAQPDGATGEHHIYRLDPKPLANPEQTLESLRRLYVQGDLPGELELAVLAAQGLPDCTVEPALIVHVPERVALPLKRDRVAGLLLGRSVAPAQFLVSRSDLSALQVRMSQLGIVLDLAGAD